MMTNTLLSINNLTASAENKTILHNLNLKIKEGGKLMYLWDLMVRKIYIR